MSAPTSSPFVVGLVPNPFQGGPPTSDAASSSESTATYPLRPVTNDPPKAKKTLAQLAEQQILEQLKEAVKGYQSIASYSCGGSIPISASTGNSPFATTASGESPLTAPPIALRWDVSGYGTARTVHFPFTETQNQTLRNTTLFNELLQACAPATFGRKDKDILDESYRKAGKLDRSQFSVDFHPHDYGIIDAISQILLPETRTGFLENREEHRGVVAELYKFNIYSGPAGKFKSRVDTPRGETQFGSLVVCLPYPHEGGQLRVTHKGHSKHFNWSNSNAAAIQWAAFYSDCEHEVLPVTSGHRITLTYNLYMTQQIGSVLQRFPTVDPALFPLYDGAKKMVAQPSFMAKGGTLAFFCSHSYAHHRLSSSTSTLLPFALKGIDMTLFTIFRSLGLSVSVRPVLDQNDYQLKQIDRHHEEEGLVFRIGYSFSQTAIEDDGGHDVSWRDTEKMFQKVFPHTRTQNLTWLNSVAWPGYNGAKGWDLAMVNMTYGNEAGMAWHYSHAVILIEVPKRGERPIF